MKSKRIIAMLCTLAVMFSSSGGLPISDRELFDSAITVNAVENVAKVDDTVYTDFNTALNNWTAGKTLTLLNDVTSSRISVLESKTLDLNGKTITFSNDNTESRVIHVGNAGTVLTLKDSSGNNSGRLTGINTPSNDWSGALYINSGATVNMYGGTISGNTSYCGAGVWIDGRGHGGNATFNMYGGVITGNNATSGGGVYVGRQNDKYAGTAHFNLYGGTITGNTATTGSNVYVDKGVMTQTGGTLDGGFVDKLDRYVSLTFNANGSSGSMSEQYIQKNVDTLIKQNTFTRNGFLYSGWNKDANGSGTGYDADGSITIDTDTTLYAQWTSIAASVTAGGTTTSYTSLSDALSAWTDGSTLTLLNDVEISSTITVSGTKTLDLNGYKIDANNGNYSVITISGGNLTLQDTSGSDNGCITGGNGITDGNNNKVRYGGGIYVDGGTLTMTGGTISGNNAKGETSGGGYGGGVAVVNSSKFTMTGGIIKDNHAGVVEPGYGGGVSLSGSSTFEMSGTAKIINNEADKQGGGGGVVVINSTFTMNAGTISGNKATDAGYNWAGATGVQMNANAKVIIRGGTITDVIKNKMTGHLYYGVTFNVNEHGIAPDAVDVESGKTVTAPIAPTVDGYILSGWYKEEECSNVWNFETDTVASVTTLYAKWLKNPAYTVTIPADVNCSNSNSASAIISAEYDVGEFHTLSVAVTSENSFQLKADYDDSVLIPYTIMCDDMQLSTGQTEILSVSGNGEQSKTLNFSIDPNQMYAGAYSDTLTFNISLT